jgi:indolepyruvate ferredoxin oxidoreductase
VVINELVCEGCGDCGIKSNCVSVAPVETEFGRKRTIDQSSCNKDFSCVKGFCPSFVTVEGGTLRKPKKAAAGEFPDLPDPVRPTTAEPYGILVTGIGGTGVVMIGASSAWPRISKAARSVLDMAGLARRTALSSARAHRRQTGADPRDRIAAGEASSCSPATS